MRFTSSQRTDIWFTGLYTLVMAVLAIVVSFPEIGETLFRGYFVQDADEIIRAWYGRCSFENPLIIPYSHLSMPGWAAILAISENIGALLGLPLTMLSRLVTVAAVFFLLRGASSWIRAIGGKDQHALCAVILLGVSPGFFLLGLSVYPSMMFASLIVNGMALWANDRFKPALTVLSLTPLIRWEGILIVALMIIVVLMKKRATLLPWLGAPYLIYLVSNIIAFGNPMKPLMFRTTRHMGAWLLFNPHLSWEQVKPALINLMTLYSPVVLLGGLICAAWGIWAHRHRLGPLPWAFSGLTVALLSIQHEWMVWLLRVFLTPSILGILMMVGLATQLSKSKARSVLIVLALGTLISTGMTFQKTNNQTIPKSGGFRSEVGYHMFVRYADASPALDWLKTNPKSFLVINHLNANLLRADTSCSLWKEPLRIGSPGMSLSKEFQPAFELPKGKGFVVFHTLADPVENCVLDTVFSESRQQIYQCGNKAPSITVETRERRSK